MDFSEQISEKEIEDHGIDIDNSTFIGDNDFASFLNFNSQIQINDSIYMYTPKGLFVINQSRLPIKELENYLERNSRIEIPEGRSKITGEILAYKPSSAILEKYELSS